MTHTPSTRSAPPAPADGAGAGAATEALGFAVWRRHAWADALGHRPFGATRGAAGMADIKRRHLAFVQPMLMAGGRDAEDDEAALPIVTGRPVAARRAWAGAGAGAATDTAHGDGATGSPAAGPGLATGPGLGHGPGLSPGSGSGSGSGAGAGAGSGSGSGSSSGVRFGVGFGPDADPGPCADIDANAAEGAGSDAPGAMTIARRIGARTATSSPNASGGPMASASASASASVPVPASASAASGASPAAPDTAPPAATANAGSEATLVPDAWASDRHADLPSIGRRPAGVTADVTRADAALARDAVKAPTVRMVDRHVVARAAPSRGSMEVAPASTGDGPRPNAPPHHEPAVPARATLAAGAGDDVAAAAAAAAAADTIARAGTDGMQGVPPTAATTRDASLMARTPIASTSTTPAHGRPSAQPEPSTIASLSPSSQTPAWRPPATLPARSGTPFVPLAPLVLRRPAVAIGIDAWQAHPTQRDAGITTSPDVDRHLDRAAHHAGNSNAAVAANADADADAAVAVPTPSRPPVAAAPTVLVHPALSSSGPTLAGHAVMARRVAPDYPTPGGTARAIGPVPDPGRDAAVGAPVVRASRRSDGWAVSATRPADASVATAASTASTISTASTDSEALPAPAAMRSPMAGAPSMSARDPDARSAPAAAAMSAIPAIPPRPARPARPTLAMRHPLLPLAREPSLPDAATPEFEPPGAAAPALAKAARRTPDAMPLPLLAAPVGGIAASGRQGDTLARSPGLSSPVPTRRPSASPPDPDAVFRRADEQHPGVVPVAAEAAAEAPPMPGVSRPPTTAVSGAAAGAAGIDLEDLVERAVQALLHKLDIERERRGFAAWP
jgi:hypothetical protein